jgi:tryptophanyl-tRNA synthetase
MTDFDPNKEVDLSQERETFLAAKDRSDAIWADLDDNAHKYRVLTGDRPTGALHIGHYFGTLANRVRLQNKGVDTFILVADYQVLTDRERATNPLETLHGVVLDYLAVGIDPFEKNTTIFCHSHIPELNQLMLPFLTLVSVQELQRNPTVKEELQASQQETMSASLLTYPVHQAADILFCKGQLVPVGKDQLPHLEMSRKIARRFNHRYGKKKRIFPLPTALLSEVPMIMGLDGHQKMSKSRGNAIDLRMTEKETSKLIKSAKTDSERRITYDETARPEVANLLRLLSLCSDKSPSEWANDIGDGGAGTLKAELTRQMNSFLAPIRARRAEYAARPDLIKEVIGEGNLRARAVAKETLAQVTAAMKIDYGILK